MPAPERNQRRDKPNGRRQLPQGPQTRQQLPHNLWLWWLIFAALLAWNFFAWWPSQTIIVNIPYSTFLTQVRADNVSKVHIVGDDITGRICQTAAVAGAEAKAPIWDDSPAARFGIAGTIDSAPL